MNSIAEELHDLISNSDMTQRYFAEHYGMDYITNCFIMAGDVKYLTDEYCKILGKLKYNAKAWRHQRDKELEAKQKEIDNSMKVELNLASELMSFINKEREPIPIPTGVSRDCNLTETIQALLDELGLTVQEFGIKYKIHDKLIIEIMENKYYMDDTVCGIFGNIAYGKDFWIKIRDKSEHEKRDYHNLKSIPRKEDSNKTRYDLLSEEFIEEFAKVMTLGSSKYTPYNWVGLEDERVFSALMRHLMELKKGNFTDEESGLSHMAHVACNAMMLYINRNPSKVIRDKYATKKAKNDNRQRPS